MSQPGDGTDRIEHVVLLLMENHSFDQMMGSLDEIHHDLDGVRNAAAKTNDDGHGHVFTPMATEERQMLRDPHHDHDSVMRQIADDNGGFVRAFTDVYPTSDMVDRQDVMGYYPLDFLTALHTLGRNFTVCDKWFSSLPGPTWPNRFFLHSGTSLGRVAMPEGILDANLHWYDQTTLYDRLDEKGKSWRIYYGDVPQSLILVHQLEPENAMRYSPMAKFSRDAAGDAKSFPQFCFIEPAYYQPGATDDHPPHDVRAGERLIASVYNAIRRNDALWKSSLLILLYDEHGGFYDHVVPPAAVPPDHHVEEYTFDQLGVRVPAILVSPFVNPGVIHTVFDHTSVLRYVSDKWDLAPLGERAARANSLAAALLAAPAAADRLPGAP